LKGVKFETILDKHGNDRLRVKLQIDKGELINVVYQYETFFEDKWKPIV